MNRPGPRTLLLGSRITAPPIMAGSGYFTYRWWEAGGFGVLGFGSIALFFASAKALGEVTAYRQWRADWTGMGPGGGSVRSKPKLHAVVGLFAALLIAAVVVYVAGPDAPPDAKLWFEPAAACSAAIGLLLILVRLVRRIPWPRRRSRMPLVSIAVDRPLMSVPSRRVCYRRLPPYCKQLLQARP